MIPRRRDAVARARRPTRRLCSAGWSLVPASAGTSGATDARRNRRPRRYDFERDVAAACDGKPLAVESSAFRDAWVKADADAKKGEYSFRAQYNVWDQSEPSKDWDGLADLGFT